jgi:prophage antirepressor-like protein
MFDPFGRRVRTFTHAGQTFFDLSEIAYVLRAANVDRLAGNLDADEVLPLSAVTGIAEDADTLLVSEPGIFKIAIRMRHPAARMLLRFVCHIVLPSLRAGGSYSLPEKGAEGAEVLRFMRDQLEGAEPDGACDEGA